jgi:hypothetical protein
MAATKPEIYFFMVFLRKTSGVLVTGLPSTLSLTKSMFSGSENLMARSKRLLRPYFDTGNDKLKMAAAKSGCTCNSAAIQESKEIPQADPMFSGSRNSIVLSTNDRRRNRK